ncbi:MAG: glycoside hydrolase family 43 protein [Longimicrobiales bacterium]|nr:glycoside hydrolase family 43 protein [Longimicrobiales bacterium]
MRTKNIARPFLAVVAAAVAACGTATQTPPIDYTEPPEGTFTNPLNQSGPDPWMTYYDGSYYLAATTWGGPGVGLTMRKAPTIEALKEAEPVQIYQDSTADRCCNYWAPEFFLLDGPDGPRWYGYFTGGAAGDDFVNTQYSLVIESEGLDPMGPYTYKGKLVERNSLDATVLEIRDTLYAVYSVWNATQDLAIKRMSSPWETVGPEVVISRPTHAWERQEGTVNEGPFAIRNDAGETFLIYAASACWGPNYKLGRLDYVGGDPVSTDAWEKHAEPVFEREDAHDVYGPGHATFFTSPDGTEEWMAYHANDEPTDGCDMGRTPRIQPYTWNDDGTPDFGVPVAPWTPLEPPAGEPEPQG